MLKTLGNERGRREMNRLFIYGFTLMLSIILTGCGNSDNGLSRQVETTSNPKIKANHEKAYEILSKFVVAEKRFAVKKGYYADIKELQEKGFFSIEDSEIKDSGYKIRIEFDGVKYVKIFMNPVEYKKTGIISFFADQTAKIRGGDHGGKDASAQAPEIE